MKMLPILNSITEISILENLGVEIEFDPQEEEITPDFENEEDVKKVCEDYDNGNRAAWFCAHVIVKYKGIEGDDYLGCCSYRSFKEFTTTDKDYYMDMINQSIDQINKEVEFINTDTQKHWNIRKAKNLIAPYNLHIVSSKILQTL